MNFEIVVVDGATGQLKYKVPTPKTKARNDRFDRILGDCLFFCDVRGAGRDGDVLIKDRYANVWVMNDRLEPLWQARCKTGHYPYAFDIDNDGRDELAIGYSLFDDDGTMLWSNDDNVSDHADGVAIVDFDQDSGTPPSIMAAASDAGTIFTNLDGKITRQHWIGHAQNPAVADFRSDLPGLEAITINYWGNQGIIHYYDAKGNIYHDFEPVHHGSMCLPVNWTGRQEEFFVLSPDVKYGGMFDGWGRSVVMFPDDGHPDLCNAVLDITGDIRDEIVVWDDKEIWIYTQDNNPLFGKLYHPVRNPLYNYSNYQMTVSLPGWFDQPAMRRNSDQNW
jgi:hypothetical protein